MSASKARGDPLDALHSLVNDVLVQTGKALRASRRDSQGNLTQAPGIMQPKLPDMLAAFHVALDELEFDIIDAKSVLLRDLNELREKKRKLTAQPEPQPVPQPVESQSKQPVTIDLDSSPALATKDHPMTGAAAVMKPMAPFPNMRIDLTDSDQMDIFMQGPSSQSQPPPAAAMNVPSASPNPFAPMSVPERKPAADMKLDVSGPTHTSGIPDTSGMSFTDMEFTLAPPANNEPQGRLATTNEPSFDLTTFAPADGGDGMLTLNNNVLPTNPAGQNGASASSSSGPAAHGTASNAQGKAEGKKGTAADSTTNNDFFNNDAGAADGMDFDFSLGGSGDDTFDDLMNNRESTFELMDAGGDFDTAFFGIGTDEH